MLKQRGLSVVELLVGVAVGLFLLGGAAKLFVDSVTDSRRLIVETRVNQDLRAAADLIARDLRRAGYWENALDTVPTPPPASAPSNPYAGVAVSGGASSAEVTYKYEKDPASEDTGFRLSGNAIQVRIGGNWQQVTDPTAVIVTQFAVTPVVRDVSLGHFCTPMCTSGSPGCPSTQVRSYDIVLVGRAATDNNVVRQIRESVRLRNDVLPPLCP
jgi:type IV pilus assembly protein PilW